MAALPGDYCKQKHTSSSQDHNRNAGRQGMQASGAARQGKETRGHAVSDASVRKCL